MKKLLLTACISAAAATANAATDSYNYVSGGLSLLDYSESGFEDYSPKNLDLGFGRRFNEYFAGEIRFNVGLLDDEQNITIYDPYSGYYYDESLSLKVDYVTSIMLKPTAPVNDKFNLYAILGYSKAKFTAELLGFSDSMTYSDTTLGLGFNYSIDDGTDLKFEYINYGEDGAAELSGITLGFQKNFR